MTKNLTKEEIINEYEILKRTWTEPYATIGGKVVKVCPFCGSPELNDTEGVGVNREYRHVTCNNCGAKGPAVKYMSAIDAWNWRVNDGKE